MLLQKQRQVTLPMPLRADHSTAMVFAAEPGYRTNRTVRGGRQDVSSQSV